MNSFSNTIRSALVVGFLSLACVLPSCGGADAAEQPTVLRFSGIPDRNKGDVAENSKKLAAWLSEKLGVEVRYQASNSYTASVNALAANKIDFAWLGGKTTCDAIDAGAGKVHVLATRDIDLKFKTYFIGNHSAVAAGKLLAVEDLGEWRDVASKLKFTFGDVNSTSGHLMPRHFLVAAGIDPDKDFASVGYAEGGHSGTLNAVATGSVDCGALNYEVYDNASTELKEQAKLLHTTPEYVDYSWVVHDRVGTDLIAKLRAALLSLKASDPEEGAILKAWSAGEFLSATDAQWDSIREVRDSLPKDFLK
ncbi:MAG: phosphonate transport system substrate-binding protein [Planctomycetota bacterium]|jgi:phosphonate transport system substrate-binding protein